MDATIEHTEDTLFLIQQPEAPNSHIINTDVVRLYRQVPSYVFEGPIREVIAKVKEFEEGFCFVPVQVPQVDGDYYLANTFGQEDPTVLPEYTQASDRYYLLKSFESLESLADGLGEDLIAKVVIEKQISAAIYDPSISDDQPIAYYVNSYNRSTRERIILGFAFLGFTYMHRRSGVEKADFHNVIEYFKDGSHYASDAQLLKDYKISLREFKKVCKRVRIPLQRVGRNMLGVTGDMWEAASNADEGEELIYRLLCNKYAKGQTMNLLNLIAWLHDLYHFNVASERFDAATRMLDWASDYLTKNLLPDAKISALL